MRYFLVEVENDSKAADGEGKPFLEKVLEDSLAYWGRLSKASEPPVITEDDGSRWISVDL
jgi:hypothetical protein